MKCCKTKDLDTPKIALGGGIDYVVEGLRNFVIHYVLISFFYYIFSDRFCSTDFALLCRLECQSRDKTCLDNTRSLLKARHPIHRVIPSNFADGIPERHDEHRPSYYNLRQ